MNTGESPTAARLTNMRKLNKAKNKKLVLFPDKKNKGYWKKRFLRGIVLFLLLYFAVLFAGQYWRLWQLQQSKKALQAEIAQIQAENEAMQQEIERLNTSSYIEVLARKELRMVRQGEILFVLPDE